MKCLDPHRPETLSKPACLCCGATWSTTCCIIPPLIPKTLCCLEIVYTDLALQMVKIVICLVKPGPFLNHSIHLCFYRFISWIADQWRAWPWSVPSQPARLGHGRKKMQLSLQLAFSFVPVVMTFVSWHPVCVSAAKERGGCQFWRGSAEEGAGGGGIVQSSPLSVHFHPGPCSQDQRTAPTAKKLMWEHIHKDWKRHEYVFILNKKCCRWGGKN